LIYTQLVNLENEDEFICKVVKTVEEPKLLIEVGLEHIWDTEDTRLFRKRK
jgi:hypothetical protein